MYLLSDGRNYIGLNPNDNKPTFIRNINKALVFNEKQKAVNFKENLKTTLKKFNWEVVEINESEDKFIEAEPESINPIEEVECKSYIQTDLEQKGFNIGEFFKTTIETMSQLKEYASNMDFLEKEYNKKILDVRHYIRDERTKLNAIQMQRIGYFLQQLERERYECKSNRLIAQMFLADLNKIEDIACIEDIKSIKESKYKPKILTYEILDEIAGKRGKNTNEGKNNQSINCL